MTTSREPLTVAHDPAAAGAARLPVQPGRAAPQPASTGRLRRAGSAASLSDLFTSYPDLGASGAES